MSRAFFAVLALGIVFSCRRPMVVSEPSLPGLPRDERCAIVDALLQHRAPHPSDPTAFRVPLVEDECAKLAAGWNGKLLIKVKAMPGGQSLFGPGETCQSFWPLADGFDAPDLPALSMILELTADGTDRWRWHSWFGGIRNADLGACVPEDGLIGRHAGSWTVTNSRK